MTSEIWLSPRTGDFDWRLSIATVDSDALFSTFPGVDRCLLALSKGLELVDEGQSVRLGAFESHCFAGENEVASANVTRPTLDLNLMTRRGRCSGTVETHRVSGRWSNTAMPGESIVIVIAEGRLAVGSERLTVLDAILLDGCASASASAVDTDTVELIGIGQIAVVRVVRAAHSDSTRELGHAQQNVP
jgi:hypothetical protein